MTTAFLKKRATKFSAYTTVYILVVLGILSTANFLANRYNKSFDSTTNKRFSLSDQTLKVVNGLKEDVTISYFDETVAFPRAKDLLDRYSTLSPKLKVELLDPFKKPTLAKQFGITQAGAIVLQTASGKRQDARSLSEEEVTSAIVRLFKKSENTACFTTGAGEHSLEDTTSGSYSAVKTLIEKNNYKTQTVNLIEKPEVPAGCTLIVVAGPRVDYPQPVVDGLKKYVEGGGRAVFLSDPPAEAGGECGRMDRPDHCRDGRGSCRGFQFLYWQNTGNITAVTNKTVKSFNRADFLPFLFCDLRQMARPVGVVIGTICGVISGGLVAFGLILRHGCGDRGIPDLFPMDRSRFSDRKSRSWFRALVVINRFSKTRLSERSLQTHSSELMKQFPRPISFSLRFLLLRDDLLRLCGSLHDTLS